MRLRKKKKTDYSLTVVTLFTRAFLASTNRVWGSPDDYLRSLATLTRTTRRSLHIAQFVPGLPLRTLSKVCRSGQVK